MEIQELVTLLTEGLPPEDSAKVRAAIERENTKARIAALKTQKDYEALQTQAAKVEELERELDYIDPQGNPRGYRAWYQRYKDEVFADNKLKREFNAKYGEGALEKAIAGQFSGAPTPSPQAGGGWTKEDLIRDMTSIIQERFAPMVIDAIATGQNLTQRHLLAGRKSVADIKSLSEMARTRFDGDLNRAYDEWDKPERERLAKEAVEKDKKDREEEIQRRVAEELAKRNVPQFFPTGADLTPSSLSQRSDEAVKGFDRTKFQNDLMTTFYNAGQERAA